MEPIEGTEDFVLRNPMLCTELSKSEDNTDHVMDLSAAAGSSTAAFSIETSNASIHSKTVSLFHHFDFYRLTVLPNNGANQPKMIKIQNFKRSKIQVEIEFLAQPLDFSK